jgi:hypothetical protein
MNHLGRSLLEDLIKLVSELLFFHRLHLVLNAHLSIISLIIILCKPHLSHDVPGETPDLVLKLAFSLAPLHPK